MKNLPSIFVYCRYAILLCCINIESLCAQNSLTLKQVIQKSFKADQKLNELTQLHQMQLNLSQAKGELPDLTMSLSAKNFPTDSFSPSQEPMTQIAVGFTQRFPGGDKMGLAKKNELNKAGVISAKIQQRKKKIELTINELWLNTKYLNRLNELLLEQKQVLKNLLSVTQSLYSVGKRNQQDVFKAEVEIESIEEQLIEVAQNVSVNQESFSRWLTRQDINAINVSQYPKWQLPGDIVVLRSRVLNHPLINMQQRNIESKKTQLKIAQESKSSDWSLGLSYSNRTGQNADLSDRSDFISVNFSIDLPYFSSHRNDNNIKASLNRLKSATYSKDDQLADLKRDLELSWKKYQSMSKRMAIFKDKLLPKSLQHKQAALNAYQRDVADFNDPMQALIQDLQLKRQFEKLKMAFYQEQANIIYLTGEE